jgi:hypothetical protein
MSINNEPKTIVGLFDDLSEARGAVQELMSQGFTQNDVNLIANASAQEYSQYFDQQGRYSGGTVDNAAAATGGAAAATGGAAAGAATGAGYGAVLGGIGGLLLGMALLPVPGIGPIVAAGPISSALMGAVAGGVVGGLLGALTSIGVPEEHANYYAEGVRRGGTLVIVKTVASMIDRASTVLNRHSPVDVQQRVSSWRQGGWNSYDSRAPLYTPEQIAADRRQYGSSGTGGAVGGAVTGAAAGSVVPGLGTAAGALTGGVVGGVAGSNHPVGTGVGGVGGAAAGAAIGSVIPVVGTAAGAVVGGVAGAVGGHEVAKHNNPQPGDRF